MLGFVGKRAAVPPQVLERKPHICVLIITNVGSSNPQDLGRLGGGGGCNVIRGQIREGGRSRGKYST